MNFKDLRVGFAMTGSFCTLESVFPIIKEIVISGSIVLPIVSYSVKNTDTRFGKAEDLLDKLFQITGNKIMDSIESVEPIGPKSLLDVLVVAPCTGNTVSKIANGITDTPVTMAVKAQLRNQKPVVISISTNDGLGISSRNIGILLNSKNIYFVPYVQDNPKKKANSIVANLNYVVPTIKEAIEGKQIQPVLLVKQ